MASWMVHFRIADKIIDKIPKVVRIPYIVGNIGPDCGEPNEDWSCFTPPTNITHWSDGNKSTINYEKFFASYLNKETDSEKWSFYLGYYIHLLTDALWSKNIARPTMEKWEEDLSKNGDFIWIIKRDWYDLDHLFLKNNPEFRTFQIFSKIAEFPNKYLEYYSDMAIMKQIRYITKFYLSEHDDLEREYIYLAEETMSKFVEEASDKVIIELKKKDIITL